MTWSRAFARAALGSLVLVGFPAPASAQVCGGGVVLNELDAGVAGPVLRTPDGAPVVGGPFSLRIENAFPNSSGALVFSSVETQFFEPLYGATFWFGVPYNSLFFATNSQGRSPRKVVVSALDPSLCGAFVVFQAGVFDPGAANGVAVTNALRMRVGVREGPLLPLSGVTDQLFADRDHGIVSIDTGDVDGDGVLDVISAGSSGYSWTSPNDRVRVNLGASAGEFESTTFVTVGSDPFTARLADLDGDTNLDIVTANADSDDVSVVLGNGNGTFGTAVSYPAGDAPVCVAAEDFDGDTELDLVAVNALSDDISVLIGNGDGTFVAAVDYSVGDGPQEVAIGDLDGDNELDLVVANITSNDVSVLLGNGDGTFGAATSISSPGKPISLGLGDFNGDGVLDMSVAHRFSGATGVFLGNGDGTFGPETLYAGGPTPVSLVVEDVDGDSALDIAVAVKGAHRVTLLPGAGDGTFGVPSFIDVSIGPRAIAFADFDGDGDRDLGVGSLGTYPAVGGIVGWYHGSLTYLPNRGDGTFAGPTHQHPGALPRQVLIEDLDDDDVKDVVVAITQSGQKASVLMGRGDGTFEDAFAVDVGSAQTSAPVLAVADFDGDGVRDIAAADWNELHVAVGIGDGTFAAPIASPTGSLIPRSIAAGDLDEDSIVDLVLLYSGPPVVRYGNGDGTFDVETALPCCSVLDGTGVAVEDLNGNTFLDIATAGSNGGNRGVWIHIGDGTGTFAAPVFYPTTSSSESVLVADVNDDGARDITLGGEVLLGIGDGTFAPAIGTSTASLAGVADMDGDGILDLVLGSDGIWVRIGNGDGTFAASATSYYAGSRHYLDVDDLDGDGIPDVVASDLAYDLVTVLINQLGE